MYYFPNKAAGESFESYYWDIYNHRPMWLSNLKFPNKNEAYTYILNPEILNVNKIEIFPIVGKDQCDSTDTMIISQCQGIKSSDIKG